jgi:hypothetical protein
MLRNELSGPSVTALKTLLTGLILYSLAAVVGSQAERLEILGNIRIFGTGNGLIFPDGTKLSSALAGGAFLPPMIGGGGSVTSFNAGVEYAPMFGDGTGSIGEDDKLTPMAQDGRLVSFRVYLANAPGSGENVAFTVRKGGLDTSVTCTASSMAKNCSDPVNAVAFAAGDLISVKSAKSGGAATGTFKWVALYTVP